MRIVLVAGWYTENMGYSTNSLPKALASLGHEVHLITSNANCYFNSPSYKDIYEKTFGPGIVECVVKNVDGYTLHRLPFKEVRGKIHLRGLFSALRNLKPDIVQAVGITCLATWEVAALRPFMQYKLFVECHWHASVFPLKYMRNLPGLRKKLSRLKQYIYWTAYKFTIGRAVATVSDRCYPISIDCAELAHRYFGFPEHKITILPLGVDTDLFKPVDTQELQKKRSELRAHLNYSDSDIVCVYTGRLTHEKEPYILAEAIGLLRAKNLPFKALFIGDGPSEYVSKITRIDGCQVQPFVATQALAKYYQASDIAVWPKYESTSQLDAIACGLPIILSDRVQVIDRLQGNGLSYLEGDFQSLAESLFSIMDPGRREMMAAVGLDKVRNYFSWKNIAIKYELDYIKSICRIPKA